MADVGVSWDNQAQTILRLDIPAGCDWNTFWVGIQTAHQLIRSVEHRVDLIVNPDPGARPPMHALRNFKQAQENSPPNEGRLVIIGAGLYVELLITTFARVYKPLGDKILLVSSLEKARATLEARPPRS